MALLAKQGWRLLTNPELLVSKLFNARYYPDTNLLNAAGGRPSFAWRGIKAALDLLRYGVEWDSLERKYYWKHDGSGALTVKSAYQIVLKLDEQRNNDVGEPSVGKETQRFWRGFWRLKIPQKIKIFGWRLFHDSLPTIQNLFRRGCAVENKCSHCGRAGEYALHFFGDCWWMKGLLQDLHLPNAVWNNQCTSLGYWMWLSAKVCLEEEFKALLCGFWLGWKHRNNILYNEENSSVESLKVKLRWMLNELRQGAKDPCWSLEQNAYPIQGPIIMCDGSYDISTKEAGGGAVMISDGIVHSTRAEYFCNLSSALEVEVKALKLGMDLALKMDLAKVFILTDSTEALWAFNLGSWRPEACIAEIKECVRVLDEHPNWAIGGIDRESNVVADWLANKARTHKWKWSAATAIPRDLPRLGSLC